MFEIIRAALAVILVFFLPGYMITKAIFPKKNAFHPDYSFVYTFTFSVVLSIITVILLGILFQSIGPNPETGEGYFKTPYIVASLLFISAVFFLIGWWRGAHPWMGIFHPSLYRVPVSPAVKRLLGDRDKATRLYHLVREREQILREIEAEEKRIKMSGKEGESENLEKINYLRERLEIVNRQIDELEGSVYLRYIDIHVPPGEKKEE